MRGRSFVGRSLLRSASDLAVRVRPGAAGRPPWERSVLDDLAMRRPWNVRVTWARRLAMHRVGRLEGGVTVIIVNWNTVDVTADVVRAVQDLSPVGTRILLVDNGSTDGSVEVFRSWPGVETMLLRSNSGHGVALDLGVCATRTTVAVTLDSDAIPLVSDWLDQIVEPVAAGRAVLAGHRSRRDFVHPIYAAVDTAAFVRRRLSFQVHRAPGVAEDDVVWGDNAWDAAELMTARLDVGEVVFVEPEPNSAPGLLGMTAGGVVYHHGGVSRAAGGAVEPDALAAWRSACTALGVPDRSAQRRILES